MEVTHERDAGAPLQLDPLHLVDCDLVFGPVVKFGGPRRLMRRHVLGMLKPASVLQVNRHTGCAPRVASDRRRCWEFLDVATEPEYLTRAGCLATRSDGGRLGIRVRVNAPSKAARASFSGRSIKSR